MDRVNSLESTNTKSISIRHVYPVVVNIVLSDIQFSHGDHSSDKAAIAP